MFTQFLKNVIEQIINEEIGRDRKTSQKIDKFPWASLSDEERAYVRYNHVDDTFTGTIESGDGAVRVKTSKDVEDVKHWIKKQLARGGV